MTAGPKLLAGLIPVPVIGMVAKCTMNTANPIGSGARTCTKLNNSEPSKNHLLQIYFALKISGKAKKEKKRGERTLKRVVVGVVAA